ncbi:MAG: indole-3-glycerol phosphate synthase TrpC [Candidatus Sericytochromatia bacterium]|nr:indole-3-glycerol phosphate synthase TrpC [Candidatus Tanganyikabacteria bacterium]
MSILAEIVAHKRSEADRLPALSAVAALPGPPRRSMEAALRARSAGGVAVIAEIKRRSPSRPLIRADFDPPAMARAYELGGAAALSVLTDERYFGGSLDDLTAARAACALPALRKDFIVDPRQVAEARQAGADAVLLIAACLSDADLAELRAEAERHDLEVLLEVHDEAEMDRALALGFPLIGINNRDLRSFTVDLATTERLAARLGSLPGSRRPLLVSESGIASGEDLRRVAAAGCQAVLVGEGLLRQADLAEAVRKLLGDGKRHDGES